MKSPLLVQAQPAARSRVTPPGWIWTFARAAAEEQRHQCAGILSGWFWAAQDTEGMLESHKWGGKEAEDKHDTKCGCSSSWRAKSSFGDNDLKGYKCSQPWFCLHLPESSLQLRNQSNRAWWWFCAGRSFCKTHPKPDPGTLELPRGKTISPTWNVWNSSDDSHHKKDC